MITLTEALNSARRTARGRRRLMIKSRTGYPAYVYSSAAALNQKMISAANFKAHSVSAQLATDRRLVQGRCLRFHKHQLFLPSVALLDHNFSSSFRFIQTTQTDRISD